MRSRWTAACAALAMLASGPSLAAANDAAVEQPASATCRTACSRWKTSCRRRTDQLESANERVDEQSAADRTVGPRGDARREQRSSRVPRADHGRRLGVVHLLLQHQHPGDSDNFADTLGPDPGDGGMETPTPASTVCTTRCIRTRTASRWTRCGSRSSGRSTRRTARGFRLDTVYGKTGALLNGGGPSNRRDGSATTRHLHQPGLRPVPRAGRRRPDLQVRQVRHADRLRSGEARSTTRTSRAAASTTCSSRSTTSASWRPTSSATRASMRRSAA